jgi:hypothetical protein
VELAATDDAAVNHPNEAEEFGRRAYEVLRWVRITDLQLEVDRQ